MPPESTPNPSYSLRDARTDEAAAVGGVISAAYAQFQPAYPPESWERFFRMVGEVGGHFERAQVIVAEQDGVIVGTVMFYPDGSASGQGVGPSETPGGEMLRSAFCFETRRSAMAAMAEVAGPARSSAAYG